MQLPIPIVMNSGGIFNEIEIMKPRASVIADTKKILNDTNEVFQSIKTFLGGCIEGIINDERVITERENIKNMINFMPFRSAEVCLYKILVLYDPEKDAIEGVYSCPRCGTKIITEYLESEGIDTRDYISSLSINYAEENKNIISELTEPVIIKNKATDEVLESIHTMELQHPVISDCITAEKKFGSTDEVRMQFAMYIEALKKINGNEVDRKYKNTWGMYIFDNIRECKKDLGELNKKISEYGINPYLTKICKTCGKEFKPPINMSNFFVSALTL